MTEIEEILPLIEYDIEEGNHINWYHAKVLLEHIASLITTIESEQLKLMQAHTYTAQLFSKQMKETKRLNAQIESQKEEIERIGKLLQQSNCYLRSIDNLLDMSEEIPNGESMGSFEDASAINAIFKKAHNFLSQEGDK